MSPWLFNVYMDAVMKEVKMGMGRMGVTFLEDEKEWKSRKSRSEEKVVGFSSASLFPARKREAVAQGGTVESGG